MNPSQNIDNSVLDSFVVDVWDTHHGGNPILACQRCGALAQIFTHGTAVGRTKRSAVPAAEQKISALRTSLVKMAEANP